MKKLLALLLLSPLAVIANPALAWNEDGIWQYLQYLLGVALIFFLYMFIKTLYEVITENFEENKKLSEEKNNTNVDINQEMLKEGEKISENINLSKSCNFICSEGETISLADNYADILTISFGIRNVSNREKCLNECFRILKPGGIFMCMEFSLPNDILLRNLYDSWSYGLIPKLGKLIVGEEGPYKYLVDSIRTFPNPEEFNDMIIEAGFKKTTIKQLTGNIVCIYRAEKI